MNKFLYVIFLFSVCSVNSYAGLVIENHTEVHLEIGERVQTLKNVSAITNREDITMQLAPHK